MILLDQDRQDLFEDTYDLNDIFFVNLSIVMETSEVNELDELSVALKTIPSFKKRLDGSSTYN